MEEVKQFEQVRRSIADSGQLIVALLPSAPTLFAEQGSKRRT